LVQGRPRIVGGAVCSSSEPGITDELIRATDELICATHEFAKRQLA
jgi:hypothetical protein